MHVFKPKEDQDVGDEQLNTEENKTSSNTPRHGSSSTLLPTGQRHLPLHMQLQEDVEKIVEKIVDAQAQESTEAEEQTGARVEAQGDHLQEVVDS